MRNEVLTVRGSSGCPLTVRQWFPGGSIKGVLQIFHGMGEHSLRYEDFAGYLTEKGWVLICYDHRQHGYSIGHDEYGIYNESDTWEAMVSDADRVCGLMKEAFADIPYVLLGHSMGSMVLRSYLQNYEPEITGAIIMGSPYAGTGAIKSGRQLSGLIDRFQPGKRSRVMYRMMNDPLASQIKDRRSDADWISYDRAQVDLYNEDMLCGYVYNAAFYREFCRGYLEVNNPENMRHWPGIKTLIISGNDDPAGGNGKGPLVAQRRYRSYGVDCRLMLMENMRHEVLNEVRKEETYKVVLEFMEECL